MVRAAAREAVAKGAAAKAMLHTLPHSVIQTVPQANDSTSARPLTLRSHARTGTTQRPSSRSAPAHTPPLQDEEEEDEMNSWVTSGK